MPHTTGEDGMWELAAEGALIRHDSVGVGVGSRRGTLQLQTCNMLVLVNIDSNLILNLG